MSKKRKEYVLRLVARCILLVLCTAAAVWQPRLFDILNGWNFFHGFSPLHLLWLIWMMDMLYQIFPLKSGFALGSRKLFGYSFRGNSGNTDKDALMHYIRTSNKAALKIVLLWTALLWAIGFLYHKQLFGKTGLFLISVIFYVCDLICVLIWCPFRLILKTKCCTSCRIFNWDHIMMFSPLIFMGGFYSTSLVVTALLAFLIWEISIVLHPERFWEKTNIALQCSQCSDKLCIQYCGKK